MTGSDSPINERVRGLPRIRISDKHVPTRHNRLCVSIPPTLAGHVVLITVLH